MKYIIIIIIKPPIYINSHPHKIQTNTPILSHLATATSTPLNQKVNWGLVDPKQLAILWHPTMTYAPFNQNPR